MNLAPIALFVYNRIEHTKKTIDALKKNSLASKSKLYIFSDGPRDEKSLEIIIELRKYLKTVSGFKKVIIIESKINKGLANSIIDGVTMITSKYERIIVLEDDLLTTIDFIAFMNRALEFYKERDDIWQIAGYNYPIEMKSYNKDIYLSYRCCSWGWGTWKDRWEKNDWEITDFEEFLTNKNEQKMFNRGGDDLSDMLISQMNKEIDSWAIRWAYNQFKNKSYCLHPVITKIKNIGLDGSGTHSKNSLEYIVKLREVIKSEEFDLEITEDVEILKNFKKIFAYKRKTKLIKLLKKIGLYRIILRIRRVNKRRW